MFEKIQEILSIYTEVEQKNIHRELSLIGDLGLSSFDVVSIISDFEDAFDIEIPDRDIKRLITVGDIENYLLDITGA